MSNQADRITQYYEANTKRFLRFAQGRNTYTIHRALDYPVHDADAGKFNRQYALIAQKFAEFRDGDPTSILDLGCGVGGGLALLAKRFEQAVIRGVTISKTQATIANAMLGGEGLYPRASVIDGDFCRLDLHQKFDLICAVESAIHCEDSKHFFQAVKRHSHQNTLLVIIDDFVGDQALQSEKNVATFRKSWRVPSLDTVASFCSGSGEFKILESLDLSDHIELQRPRDRVIGAFFPLMKAINVKSWPFLDNMIGGHCLQQSLLNGDIRYVTVTMGTKPGL